MFPYGENSKDYQNIYQQELRSQYCQHICNCFLTAEQGIAAKEENGNSRSLSEPSSRVTTMAIVTQPKPRIIGIIALSFKPTLFMTLYNSCNSGQVA